MTKLEKSKAKTRLNLPTRAEFLRTRLSLWELNRKEAKTVNNLIDAIHHIINNAVDREKK